MKCSRCHADNDEGARFCEDCGARLEQVCPRCGEVVGAGKKFCRSCGAALVPEPDSLPAPQAYTCAGQKLDLLVVPELSCSPPSLIRESLGSGPHA